MPFKFLTPALAVDDNSGTCHFVSLSSQKKNSHSVELLSGVKLAPCFVAASRKSVERWSRRSVGARGAWSVRVEFLPLKSRRLERGEREGLLLPPQAVEFRRSFCLLPPQVAGETNYQYPWRNNTSIAWHCK